MTESKFEEVSLLVDDEVDQQTLTDTIKDPQMAATWHNYHLIGDVMRGEAPAVLDFALSDKIAQAIAQEPTILAPQRATLSERFKANVVKLIKPIGQVAIAASAAVIMITAVQQNSEENSPIVATPVIQTMPFGGVASPVSYDVPQRSQLSEKQELLEQQQRFQALFLDHQQQLKIKKLAASDLEKPQSPATNLDGSTETTK